MDFIGDVIAVETDTGDRFEMYRDRSAKTPESVLLKHLGPLHALPHRVGGSPEPRACGGGGSPACWLSGINGCHPAMKGRMR